MTRTNISVYGLGLFFSFILITSCGPEKTTSREDNPQVQTAAALATIGKTAKQNKLPGSPTVIKPGKAKDSKPITQNAELAPDLDIFASVIKEAGLLATLNGTGPYTVFAPSDDAFDALPGSTLEDLKKPENKHRLAKLLSNHVVAGKLDETALQSGSNIKTLSNCQLQVETQGEMVMLNGAEVRKESIPSSNGIIYIIDKVLVPDN